MRRVRSLRPPLKPYNFSHSLMSNLVSKQQAEILIPIEYEAKSSRARHSITSSNASQCIGHIPTRDFNPLCHMIPARGLRPHEVAHPAVHATANASPNARMSGSSVACKDNACLTRGEGRCMWPVAGTACSAMLGFGAEKASEGAAGNLRLVLRYSYAHANFCTSL